MLGEVQPDGRPLRTLTCADEDAGTACSNAFPECPRVQMSWGALDKWMGSMPRMDGRARVAG
jgi:hypothetical protein